VCLYISHQAEDLFTRLTVSKVAISSTIMREELRARLPVFYSSKALLDDGRAYCYFRYRQTCEQVLRLMRNI